MSFPELQAYRVDVKCMEEASWGRYISGKDVTNHRKEGVDWKSVKKHKL